MQLHLQLVKKLRTFLVVSFVGNRNVTPVLVLVLRAGEYHQASNQASKQAMLGNKNSMASASIMSAEWISIDEKMSYQNYGKSMESEKSLVFAFECWLEDNRNGDLVEILEYFGDCMARVRIDKRFTQFVRENSVPQSFLSERLALR